MKHWDLSKEDRTTLISFSYWRGSGLKPFVTPLNDLLKLFLSLIKEEVDWNAEACPGKWFLTYFFLLLKRKWIETLPKSNNTGIYIHFFLLLKRKWIETFPSLSINERIPFLSLIKEEVDWNKACVHNSVVCLYISFSY